MDIKSRTRCDIDYKSQKRNNKILYRIEHKIEKLMNIISIVSIAPCIIVLVFWVFLITTYVIGRHFFNLQWTFVEEITGYMMVFIGYMALAYVFKVGGHIEVKFIFNRLTNKAKSILELITTGFVAFPMLCYLIWRSIQWFYYGFEHKITSNNLHIFLWPVYLFVTIGLSLFVFEVVLDFCLKIIKLKKISYNNI